MSRAAEPSSIPTTFLAGLAILDSPGDGPPVVLVPGYTGSKEDFGPIVAELGRRGIAIDLPGQFESPGPEELEGYTTAALAARVLDLVRELGEPVHLVGHSFGGLVCRSAVLQEPGLVRSLVLLCSGPSAVPPPRAWEIELLVQGTPGKTIEEVWDTVAEFRRAQGQEEPSTFAGVRWKASSAVGLVGMGTSVLGEEDLVGHLAALRIPTLVLTGELDDAWPVAVQTEMAQRLGCTQGLIAGAGHSPAIEAPGTTAEALRQWLGEH